MNIRCLIKKMVWKELEFQTEHCLGFSQVPCSLMEGCHAPYSQHVMSLVVTRQTDGGGGHFWHPPQGGRVAASMTAHFIGKHWQGARVSYHTLHCISHIALASGKSAILEGLSPFEIIILHWFFNKFCEQRRNLKEYISEICYVAW